MEYSCNLIFAELNWMSRQINLLKRGVLHSAKDLINVLGLGLGLVTWVTLCHQTVPMRSLLKAKI